MIRYTVKTRGGLLRYTVRFVVFWGLALALWWRVEDHWLLLVACLGFAGIALMTAAALAMAREELEPDDCQLERDRDRESVGPVHNPRL